MLLVLMLIMLMRIVLILILRLLLICGAGGLSIISQFYFESYAPYTFISASFLTSVLVPMKRLQQMSIVLIQLLKTIQ